MGKKAARRRKLNDIYEELSKLLGELELAKPRVVLPSTTESILGKTIFHLRQVVVLLAGMDENE